MSEDSKKLTEQLVEAAKNSNIDPNLIEGLLTAIKEVLGETVLDVRAMPVKEIAKRYDDIRKLFNDQAGKLTGVIDLEEKKLDLLTQEADDLKRKIEFMVTQEELDEEQLKAARVRFKAIKDAIKYEEQVRAGAAKGEAAAERLLQATFGISKGFENISKKGLMEGFKKGLLETLSVSNILVSLGAKMFETMMRMDTARADLFSNAQITRDQLKVGEAAAAMGAIGTNLEGVAAKAATALKQNFLAFGELTTGPDSQLQSLTAGIGIISKLGVDMNTQADIIGTQIKALGQTPDQAEGLLFNLVGVSKELGRPASEMLQDFKNAQPILARFEAEMGQKIFKDTAYMASKLGIEVNQLLQMSENMDTFEGAAKFAQNINIAFGAPLVSAQALLAARSPAEKRKVIMDSLRNQGRSIKEMSARQLRALSFETGFGGDTAKMQQFFDQEIDTLGEDRENLDNVATSMESTQELVAKQLSVSSKLDANIEEAIRMLVNAVGGEAGLMTLTEGIVGVINYLADNLFVFAGIMTAMALGKFGAGAATVATVVGMGFGGQLASDTLGGGIGEREEGRMQDERSVRIKDMTEGVTPENAPSPDQEGQSKKVEATLKNPLKNFGSGPATSTSKSSGSSSVGRGGGATAQTTIVAAAATQDAPSAMSPGSSSPVMATPNIAKNYVTPVFDKKDHFYAAKSDGALAKMIKEITSVVDEIVAKKSNLKLSMSERQAGQMVKDGLNAIKRF